MLRSWAGGRKLLNIYRQTSAGSTFPGEMYSGDGEGGGSVDLPLSGGPDVLRAIYIHGQDGRRGAYSGETCYFQIVEWDREGNVSAESIHQYGTATLDTASVHYADHAPLFAEQRLKPVWMKM